jgi:hypothetical protein
MSDPEKPLDQRGFKVSLVGHSPHSATTARESPRIRGNFRGRLSRDWSQQLGYRRISPPRRRIIVDCSVKGYQRGSRTSSFAEKNAAVHSEHLHLG